MTLAAKLCISALVLALLPSIVATEAGAADTKIYRITYPITATGSGPEATAGPGGARSCRGSVSLLFNGTGPEATTLNVNVLDQPPACFVASPSALGGDWQIDWSTDCVNPTNFIVAEFTTPKGPINMERAYWANALGDSIAPAIVEELSLPGANDTGLLVLMAALGLAGLAFLARRRTSVGNA